MIHLKFYDSIVKALIDSGSTDCYVGPKFFEKLPSARNHKYKLHKKISATVANGMNFECMEAINLNLNFEGDTVPVTAYFCECLPYELILGYHFLKRNRFVVDFETLHVSRKTYSHVKLVNSVSIPPMSESVVKAYLQGPQQSGFGLVTGNEQTSNWGLLTANVLVRYKATSQLIPIKLLNLGKTTIDVPENFCIGKYENISAENIFEEKNMSELRSMSTCNSITSNTSRKQFLEQFSIEQNSDPANIKQLEQLLYEYRDIFPSENDPLKCTNLIEFSITLRPDAKPLKARPYRSNPLTRREVKKQIEQMLNDGIIRPSTSNYVSPVLLVKKADGSLRFVTDFRKNNTQNIEPQTAPLPRIDDSLESLGSSNAKLFSTLDMLKGYWQIPVAESSKQYTAFVTHDGVFEYNRMPFGLANSPACFMRLMTRVLQGLMWETCLVYIDDIIVFSANFEQHLERLQQIFDRIRKANLSLKPRKCSFLRTETKFLGHIISSDGIKPLPEKISTIKNYPRPQDKKEILSFLGLVGYYRKFIKDFSKIAGPLHDLARRNATFIWTTSHETAFCTLRNALINPPVLAYPDYDKPYILETDASADAVGYVLSQKIDGVVRPIAYSGKRLGTAQKNYSVTEKEALAVVQGFVQFDSFLRGNKVKVVTDHVALKWLLTHKSPQGRIARWIAFLQQFNFEVTHKPGRKHANADCLSRITYDDSASDIEDKIDEEIFEPYSDIRANALRRNTNMVFPTTVWSHDDVRSHQNNDEFCFGMIKYLESKDLPQDDKLARSILLKSDRYVVNNRVLYKVSIGNKRSRLRAEPVMCLLVVPKALQHDVLASGHGDDSAGHFGTRRTYESLRLKYTWDNMFKDVYNWVISCKKCNTKKNPVRPGKALLNPLPPVHFGERWAMDLINMPRSDLGNKHILSFTEYSTRFVEAFAIPNSQAPTIARVLVDEICFRYGAPRCLLSDLGQNLISVIVAETCKLFNIERVHTSSYHPQCNGLLEKANETICKNLAMFVNPQHTNWDCFLKAVCYAYNTSVCTESTQFTPYYLMYGRMPVHPIDTAILPNTHENETVREVVVRLHKAREAAFSNIIESQRRMKERYDKTANPIAFEPGDLVWVYFPQVMVGGSRKFFHNYSGPYILLEKISPVDFKVAHAHNGKELRNKVHVNRMKPFHHRSVMPEPISSEQIVSYTTDDIDDVNPNDQPRLQTQPTSQPGQLARKSNESSQEMPSLPEPIRFDSPQPQVATPQPKLKAGKSAPRDYAIERILGKRKENGEVKYYIKWKGYDSSHNSLEPFSNLNASAQKFVKKNKNKLKWI